MKALLVFLLIASWSMSGQRDSIFLKDGGLINCKITLVNSANIFYDDTKGFNVYISRDKVERFVQTPDPTPAIKTTVSNLPVKKVQDQITILKENLGKFHKQYSVGTAIFGSGLGIGVLFGYASISVASNEGTENAFPLQVISGAGFLASFIGGIIMIDSHKWIKRASLGVSISENQVALSYQF